MGEGTEERADFDVEGGRAILRFRVAGSDLGVDARAIEVVVERDELTPIPCAPAHVTGLIAVRGDALPVLDLAAFFGLDGDSDASDREPRVLVVRSPLYRVGILCDAITGILRVPEDRIEAPRACQPASLRRLATGETFVDGAVTPLLDLEGLLEAARAR